MNPNSTTFWLVIWVYLLLFLFSPLNINNFDFINVFNQSELESFFVTAIHEFFFICMELFDESLVLLKRKWNWTLSDILYQFMLFIAISSTFINIRYIRLNDACASGYRHYDKKQVICSVSILIFEFLFRYKFRFRFRFVSVFVFFLFFFDTYI